MTKFIAILIGFFGITPHCMAQVLGGGLSHANFNTGDIYLKGFLTPKNQGKNGVLRFERSYGFGISFDHNGLSLGSLDDSKYQTVIKENTYLYLRGNPDHFWYDVLSIECVNGHFVGQRHYSEMYQLKNKIDHRFSTTMALGEPARWVTAGANPWILEPLIRKYGIEVNEIPNHKELFRELCTDEFRSYFDDHPFIFNMTNVPDRRGVFELDVVKRENIDSFRIFWDWNEWDQAKLTEMRNPPGLTSLNSALSRVQVELEALRKARSATTSEELEEIDNTLMINELADYSHLKNKPKQSKPLYIPVGANLKEWMQKIVKQGGDDQSYKIQKFNIGRRNLTGTLSLNWDGGFYLGKASGPNLRMQNANWIVSDEDGKFYLRFNRGDRKYRVIGEVIQTHYGISIDISIKGDVYDESGKIIGKFEITD